MSMTTMLCGSTLTSTRQGDGPLDHCCCLRASGRRRTKKKKKTKKKRRR
jgi:hypothetical protein